MAKEVKEPVVRLRSKAKRLSKKAEIEWLDHPERIRRRAEIKKLTTIVESIEEDKTLDETDIDMLSGLTGSDEPETWTDALYDLIETATGDYESKLKLMAQHDLTAYHEYINPNEPPAHHHIWMSDELMLLEAGLTRTLLLSMPPGVAKPVRHDTLVTMADSSTKQIKDVAAGDEVIGKDGRAHRVVAVHAQGVQPILRVDTKNYRTVYAAPDHPFLTTRGWVKADELLLTDSLAVVAEPVFNTRAVSEIQRAEARLAGYFVGDGCTTIRTNSAGVETVHATITQADKETVSDISRCAQLLGFVVTITAARKNPKVKVISFSGGVRPWLRKIDLAGKTSFTKTVPSFVADGDIELKKEFLAGYFACDGTAHFKYGRGKKTTHTRASLTSVSLSLVCQMRELFAALGVDANLYFKPSNYKKKDDTNAFSYILLARTQRDVQILTKQLDGYLVGPKMAHLRANAGTPTVFQRKYFADEVLSIVPSDPAECFCLTVENAASFVANGLVVHNSSYGSRSFTQWCMGRNPDWSVLMGGYNQKFSDNEFSKPNRDTINSDRYRDVFPDIFLGENDQAADHWKLDGWRGKYYSRGANAGVAGIRSMLTNLDDPIGKAETAKSPTERDKLWRWLTTDIMPRRLPGNRLLMIETRWHSEDPIGRLETLYNTKPEAIIGPVKIINVPAQALEGVEDPLGRKPGEWIWERNLDGTPHYTEQHYQTLQLTMPPGDWAALYMGQPLDGKGDYVEEDNFQRYQTLPKVEDRGVVTISVDTAQKATERSNYTAITVWIKDVNRKHYLAYAQRVKNKMDDVVPLLTRLALNWTANSILIEDAGFGSQILQNYQGKLPCPLVEYSPHSRSSKEFQFENAVEYIISGQCLFPEQAPWLTDYINELVAFPDGTNDDYVDSTAQYITHAVKFRRGGTKKLKVGSKRR